MVLLLYMSSPLSPTSPSARPLPARASVVFSGPDCTKRDLRYLRGRRYIQVDIWKIPTQPPKKMLQKVSQLILVGLSVLYNILKVYQSRTPGKVFFFQDGFQDGSRNLLMIITM